MDSDKSAILSSQDDFTTQERENPSADSPVEQETTYATVHPIVPDDLPPPYSPSVDGVRMFNCKVCDFETDITGMSHLTLVKCSFCQESSPLKNAPPGKMYVRCTCEALLVCKSSLRIILCPRSTCKRILKIEPLPGNPIPPSVPEKCEIICGHCNSRVALNNVTNALVRCPQCGKPSVVGNKFGKIPGIACLVAALFFLAVGLGVNYNDFPDILKDACIFIACGYLLGRAQIFFSIKSSSIAPSENPV